MSHGDAESSRVNDSGEFAPRRAAEKQSGGGDEFGRAVSKVAVAQICDAVGFLGCKESALDSLADVAIRYLCDLGKMANYYANLAGRTESNVFDVVRGLEDLESLQGFSGAGEVRHCLGGSGTMKGIVQYVETAEEIMFAQPLPWFPVVKDRRLIPIYCSLAPKPKFPPKFPNPKSQLCSLRPKIKAPPLYRTTLLYRPPQSVCAAIEFVVMGFVGIFVKLIFIPINNIIVGYV